MMLAKVLILCYSAVKLVNGMKYNGPKYEEQFEALHEWAKIVHTAEQQQQRTVELLEQQKRMLPMLNTPVIINDTFAWDCAWTQHQVDSVNDTAWTIVFTGCDPKAKTVFSECICGYDAENGKFKLIGSNPLLDESWKYVLVPQAVQNFNILQRNLERKRPGLTKFCAPNRTSGRLAEEQKQSRMMESPVPEGWTEHTDASSGKKYYFNRARNLSQWEKPTIPDRRRRRLGHRVVREPMRRLLEAIQTAQDLDIDAG